MSWVWIYNSFYELIEISQYWIEILNTWKQGVQDLFFLTPKEHIVSSTSLNKESACSSGHFSGVRSTTAKVLTPWHRCHRHLSHQSLFGHYKARRTIRLKSPMHLHWLSIKSSQKTAELELTWAPSFSLPSTIPKWGRWKPVRFNDMPMSHRTCEW